MNHSTLMVGMGKLPLKNINYMAQGFHTYHGSWVKILVYNWDLPTKHWVLNKTSAKKQSNSHITVEKKGSNINQNTLVIMKKSTSQAAIKSTECSKKKEYQAAINSTECSKKKVQCIQQSTGCSWKKPAMHEPKHWVLRRKFQICTCHKKKNIYFFEKK